MFSNQTEGQINLEKIPQIIDKIFSSADELVAQYRSRCPDDETIAAHVDGLLSEERKIEIEQHLERCFFCRKEVAELKEWLAELDAAVETEPELTQAPWEVLLGNLRSSAARIVKPFVQFFFPNEAPQFDTILDKLYQILDQGLLRTPRMQPIPQEAMGFSGSGRRGARKLYSIPLILSTLDVLEQIVQPLINVPAPQEQSDILTQIKARKQEIIDLIQERGLTPEQARQFAEYLIRYLEEM